jgi:hypothetical protein
VSLSSPLRVLPALGVLVYFLFCPTAYCQVEMDLEAPPKVEVGQQFEVKLDAQSAQGSPVNPRLNTPPGLEVGGPSVGTSWRMNIVNGRMNKTTGLNARWVLLAARVGKLTIGPAVVELDGSKYQSRTVTVEVVPQGSLPQRRRSSPFGWPDPFDPFGGRIPGMDDIFGSGEPEQPSNYPKELDTPAALDPIAFLRVEATPTRVYVGQQVTLKVFAYGNRGRFQEQSAKEPSRTDFFSIPVVEGATLNDVYRVPVGDGQWYAAKVREMVLFPLRAGELPIGAMEFGFGGGRYGASGRPLLRSSQPLSITVAEPPLEGRPSGYQVGDVGRFTLSAEVAPREIEAGGSVAAVVTLSGLGNLPQQLRVPSRTGVDFLAPTVKHTPRLEAGSYGGSKVFTYVIRLDNPGNVDLGEITLPFFDPQTQQYDIARAVLGQITVKPSTRPAVQATAGQPGTSQPNATRPSNLDQLQRVLSPRTTLARTPPSAFFSDHPLAWLLLVLTPLSVVVVQGSLQLKRRLAAWFAGRRSSFEARINEQLSQARVLLNSEPAAAASALERAVYLMIEARFQIKGRGMLRPELARMLRAAGVSPDSCERVTQCLETCDSVRFAPLAAATLAELHRNVQQIVEELRETPLTSARPHASSNAGATA